MCKYKSNFITVHQKKFNLNLINKNKTPPPPHE